MRTRRERATRGGSILLEVLLSIALFAGAAALTILALRNALASTERSERRAIALDLATSAIARLEAGIADEHGDSPEDRAESLGMRLRLDTSPSAFADLVVAQAVVTDASDGSDGSRLASLTQLVRLPTRGGR